jgi:hypothetical protein
MRTGEAALAQDLAKSHPLVFLDGPLAVMGADPQPIVGFIKSHHRHYLEPEEEEVLPRLGCGQRTPLFAFGEPRPRYSWYLRTASRVPLASIPKSQQRIGSRDFDAPPVSPLSFGSCRGH